MITRSEIDDNFRFERLRGKRLLVKLENFRAESSGGVLIPDSAIAANRASALIGRVLQVGDDGVMDGTTAVAEGDRVLLTPWAGRTNGSYLWDNKMALVNWYEVWAVLSEDTGAPQVV